MGRVKGLVIVALVVALVGAGIGLGAIGGSGDTATEGRPNVLLIYTDDQPVNTEIATPRIAGWFRNGGTTFRNAYATTAVCCPAKATMLTGKYSHNHGVETNGPHQEYNHDHTLQTQLGAAGYRTGYVGKYLNGWRRAPEFDEFAVVSGYYNRGVRHNGGRRTKVRYSPQYVFGQAGRWARKWGSEGDQPWFITASVFAPHYPFDAQPRFRGRKFPWRRPPSVGARVDDKPRWVSQRQGSTKEGAQLRQQQLRTLLSVDVFFKRMVRTLREADQLRNTLIIFTSDNGMMWGQHGLTKKIHPYQESVRVPMYARGPGVPSGEVSRRLVAHTDIAPTIYRVTGVAPTYAFDGRDLTAGEPRDELLLEYRQDHREMPAWGSLVTRSSQYTRYRNGEEEYYDLARDRYQLENLAGEIDTAPLRSRLAAVADCVGDQCP